MQLIIGHEYKRRELFNEFGGNAYSGISYSLARPELLVFTSPAGQSSGYTFDGFQPDGMFHYTGEGQTGNQTLSRGNKAIATAAVSGRAIHVFEQVRESAHRYLGKASYAGHHLVHGPDRNGADRELIVFELAFEPDPHGVPIESFDTVHKTPDLKHIDAALENMSLAELREAALASGSAEGPTTARTTVYRRSQAVKRYALGRADGTCELCEKPAPFLAKTGAPFLEVHHLARRADGGPDHPGFVSGLCPNCHRRIHNSNEGKDLNSQLAARIAAIEGAVQSETSPKS